jgi:hypothetical protein
MFENIFPRPACEGWNHFQQQARNRRIIARLFWPANIALRAIELDYLTIELDYLTIELDYLTIEHCADPMFRFSVVLITEVRVRSWPVWR